MFAHCGKTSDLTDPEPEEAQAAALAPGGASDPIELVTFTERLERKSELADRPLVALACLCPRRAVGKVAGEGRGIDRAWPELAWLSWPVLAIGHAGLGHADAARDWLARARDWRRRERRRQLTESAGFTPPEWPDFELIYREASVLISGREPADDEG